MTNTHTQACTAGDAVTCTHVDTNPGILSYIFVCKQTNNKEIVKKKFKEIQIRVTYNMPQSGISSFLANQTA